MTDAERIEAMRRARKELFDRCDEADRSEGYLHTATVRRICQQALLSARADPA